ncbi:H-type small acid-soluble spore protein [Halobacillus halophilus]|uniref:H-type small acid-soluble spore protein n=1 Tax=Halobacillus halophilus TaxID=1570 RepID=UPI001CD7535C|nr:H-type small acid-soluble spore protein [Halobacillus halophilus]MCA1011537.1 H-type small acid-soluble spore protein [Halobacillus halophilus]
MNKERAKEIFHSPEMIAVTHEDRPVYIEEVIERSETARIHPVDQPNIFQEVPLYELKETEAQH